MVHRWRRRKRRRFKKRLCFSNGAVSFTRFANDEAGEREQWTTARKTTKRNGNAKRARFIAYFHGSWGPGYRASTVKVKKRVSLPDRIPRVPARTTLIFSVRARITPDPFGWEKWKARKMGGAQFYQRLSPFSLAFSPSCASLRKCSRCNRTFSCLQAILRGIP